MIRTLSTIMVATLVVLALVGCRSDRIGDSTAGASPVPFTDDEAALIDLLLAPTDLPGTWGEPILTVPDGENLWAICDSPAFPDADKRLAGIQAEYHSLDGRSLVRQEITRLPENIAVEAMDLIRERSTCTEWIDESGTRVLAAQAEAPQIGDDAFAMHTTMTGVDDQKVEGDITVVRFGGYIMMVTTQSQAAFAPAFSHDVVQQASAILVAQVGTPESDPELEAILISELVSLDDLSTGWEMPQAAHRSDVERWTGLCNADPFPRSDRARARVGVEFYEGDTEDSASLSQLLVTYPESVSAAAFAYEREAASCRTFRRGTSTVTLNVDTSFPAVGDESFAARFTFTLDERNATGYWVVIRVGDRLTTLIFTDPTDLNVDDVVTLAEIAVARLPRSDH